MSHNRNPKPPYPPQFRQQMVELVAAGRRPSELAKEFGCHETSILSWVRRAAAAAESSASAAPGLHANERAELMALRRENRQIKLERDILAKACDHGLQEKANRRPQRLLADCSQPKPNYPWLPCAINLKSLKAVIKTGMDACQANALRPTSHCWRRLKQRTLKAMPLMACHASVPNFSIRAYWPAASESPAS